MTKEKIDRQLAGQSFLTPFMKIKDGYISKKVTFDKQDILHEKIDRLTSMMSKLPAKMTNKISNLSLRYIKARGEDRQEMSVFKTMSKQIIYVQIILFMM